MLWLRPRLFSCRLWFVIYQTRREVFTLSTRSIGRPRVPWQHIEGRSSHGFNTAKKFSKIEDCQKIFPGSRTSKQGNLRRNGQLIRLTDLFYVSVEINFGFAHALGYIRMHLHTHARATDLRLWAANLVWTWCNNIDEIQKPTLVRSLVVIHSAFQSLFVRGSSVATRCCLVWHAIRSAQFYLSLVYGLKVHRSLRFQWYC